MPVTDPQVGETWEFDDPQMGRPSQAVISSASPTAISLLTRLGRAVAVPRRSFLMVWRFILGAPGETCAYASCESPGFLQVQDLGSWVWVCEGHRPAWVQPLLPTDSPQDESLPGGLSQCPCCGSGIHGQSNTAHQIEGTTFVVRRCNSCTRQWSLLIGHNDPEDGIRFAEAVQEVATLFENQGQRAYAMTGSVALDAMRRAAGGLGSITGSPQIAGIELQSRDEFGSNNVIVVGENVRTGVQSLGSGEAHVHGDPIGPGVTRLRGDLLLPQLGTLWRSQQGESVQVLSADREGVRLDGGSQPWTVSVEAFFAEFTEERDHVAVEQRPGASARLMPQLNTIWQGSHGTGLVLVISVSDGQHSMIGVRPTGPDRRIDASSTPQELELRQFLGRFRPYVGQAKSEAEPESGLAVSPGATQRWWHRHLMSPVTIMAVGTAPNGDEQFVRFSLNNGPATSMMLSDFVSHYVVEAPDPPCSEGDELVNSRDQIFQVNSIDLEAGKVELLKSDGQSLDVSWRSIATEYTRLERLTRASVLMGDD